MRGGGRDASGHADSEAMLTLLGKRAPRPEDESTTRSGGCVAAAVTCQEGGGRTFDDLERVSSCVRGCRRAMRRRRRCGSRSTGRDNSSTGIVGASDAVDFVEKHLALEEALLLLLLQLLLQLLRLLLVMMFAICQRLIGFASALLGVMELLLRVS
jgi:hypothetical protein